MSKIWSIAAYHFRQETGRRSFLIVLFSLPLFLVFVVAMGLLFGSVERETATIGYVDQAGLLVEAQVPGQNRGEVQLMRFDTREAARAALDAGRIGGFYVLPATFSSAEQAELVYRVPPPAAATQLFWDIVVRNAMAGQSREIVERAVSGAEVTMRSLNARRDYPASGPSAGQALPIVAALIFLFLALTTSGYLLRSLTDEKENRTIEVIMSSVSPFQMMAGKVAGGIAMALLQLAAWLLFLIAAVWVGSRVLDFAWLQTIEFGWRDLLLLLLVALPAFFCLAALMTLLGTLIGEGQEAQQASGLFLIPVFVPVYLIVPIAQHANGPLALGLSLFPLTSVLTLAIRSIFQEIAAWQFLVAAAIALGCGLGAVWIAGQTFRTSMLRYGQRIDLRRGARRSSSLPGRQPGEKGPRSI